jgi:hypothetical protein
MKDNPSKKPVLKQVATDLKMEVTSSSKMLVDFQWTDYQTIQCYVPETYSSVTAMKTPYPTNYFTPKTFPAEDELCLLTPHYLAILMLTITQHTKYVKKTTLIMYSMLKDIGYY